MIYAIPVSVPCVQTAASAWNIPLNIVKGVLSTEGGWVGLAHKNINGSVDYGPMQVNSSWLPLLRRAGITAHMLQYNGCLNVYVGVWILAKIETKYGSLGEAIGYYHTRRPEAAYSYALKVLRAVHGATIQELVLSTDRAFRPHTARR